MKEHESDSETEGAETVRCPHVVGSSPTGGATTSIWNKPATITFSPKNLESINLADILETRLNQTPYFLKAYTLRLLAK